MASKEELHSLIDRLPEAELQAARRFLEYLCERDDPVLRALLNAPEDDEPTTPEEDEAVAESGRSTSEERRVRWKTCRRTSTGERASRLANPACAPS